MDTTSQEDNPAEFVQEIRDEALGTLLTATTVVSIAFIAVGFLIYTGGSRSAVALSCGLVVFVLCQVSALLRRQRAYFIAAALYLSSGVAAISMTVPDYGVRYNSYLFFVPLLVMVAALLLRPAIGFLIAAVTMGSVAAIALRLGFGADLIRGPFFAALLLSSLSAALMLLSSQGFIAAVDWALDSYRRVHRREQQLYESERRLQLALGRQDQLNIELTRSNQAIERARAAAEDANRLKSQFVRNMSHELRTPLNAIIGLSYILSQEFNGTLNPEQRDYTDRIYDSGNHLLRLLNDVLDNAKMEAGKLDLTLEPLLLEGLVAEALTTAQVLIRDKPITLRQEVQLDLPQVYTDRLRTVQVMLNLLSNAAKFTEHGVITLRARQVATTNLVMVEVEDTGIGIAPEYHELIFEEFRQVDEALSRRYGGTGLGLPISRRLVELLGGKLTLTSQPGHGSTFRFTLPIATPAQIAAVESTSAALV